MALCVFENVCKVASLTSLAWEEVWHSIPALPDHRPGTALS